MRLDAGGRAGEGSREREPVPVGTRAEVRGVAPNGRGTRGKGASPRGRCSGGSPARGPGCAVRRGRAGRAAAHPRALRSWRGCPASLRGGRAVLRRRRG